MTGLRTVLYGFMEKEYMEHFKIKTIKVDKKIKTTYNNDELKRLLMKPNMKKCDFAEYRNWVIVNYLFATRSKIKYIN